MRKQISAAVMAIIMTLTSANFSFAKTSLTDEQIGAISQNCSSIKGQLKAVQVADSRYRVLLGSYYESVATNLMMNLNSRLIKNGISNTDIYNQQASFISERERFKADFSGYSQALDNLLSIDCKNEPQKFYNQLEKVRRKRSDVYWSTWRLRETLDYHRESVIELRKELK